MARSDVHPIHTFKSWQVWPGSYDNPPADGDFPFPGRQGLQIDRDTRIASMGSCFAREIRTVLVREGYAYITEETDHPASKHASAAWERPWLRLSLEEAGLKVLPIEVIYGAEGTGQLKVRIQAFLEMLTMGTELY